MKQILARTLPEPLQARLLRLRKPARRVRHRVREGVRPVTVTRAELADALSAAGLERGEGAFVHSALSRLGTVAGGPATVVSAFGDVLGPDGLLAMPSFPYVGSTVEYLRADPLFDVRETPSRVGAVTEYFRTLPGTVRSLHPTHPVCARGHGAAGLVSGHAAAETPFGPGSPFARMVEQGLHQVWLGVGIATFTMYHTFEALEEAFPFRPLLPERFPTRCIDWHGEMHDVATLAHDPKLSSRKDKFRHEMRRHLVESGVLRVVPLGRGELLAAPMPGLMEQLAVLMRRGVTIYDLDPPDMTRRAA